MSEETPSTRREIAMSEETPSTTPVALRGIIIGLLLALAMTAAFALHERTTAHQLSVQNEYIASALKETQGQMQSLNDKINTLATPPAPVPAPPVASVAASAKKTAAKHFRHAKDDPRWKKVQAQLDEQGQQIEATRQDLSGARTELQGSIARTHDELVLLQKKGERSYYEFDLDKAKQFHSQGPLGIRLKKANPKRQYADLEMMVDDANVSQKHVNLYQPVVFYAAEGGRPVEIVINRISKNHIHGYVSEPKYKHSELAAMGPAPASSGSSEPTAAPGATRRKLPAPQ